MIRLVRGHKVILGPDLASLYEVPVKALNQAVRRNPERFPPDFMFQLTDEEHAGLRSQIVTLKEGRRGKHSKYLPYAFTEHGVAMLCSVLNSPRAVQMNILIVRAFVRLREILAANQDLARRIDKVEDGQQKTVSIIELLAEDIENLSKEVGQMKALPAGSGRKIGFAR